MNCVNNCLIMSNTLDAQEIALERLKNVLVIFEKKKRNLDKRKNKLDEYKKKKDLNEDQQVAVSKYAEVVSNLELVDELSALAVSQIRDAEKALKKVKKLERLEVKRHEAALVEFAMRTCAGLERVFGDARVSARLAAAGAVEEAELAALRSLYTETHMADKANWKKCSEQLQALFEGGAKPLDLPSEESALRAVSRDELLRLVEKVAAIDWAVIGEESDSAPVATDLQQHQTQSGDANHHSLSQQHHQRDDSVDLEDAVPAAADDSAVAPDIQQPVAEKAPTLPPSSPSVSQQPVSAAVETNSKLSFTFLHESVVQDDAAKCSATENGFDGGEHAPARSSSQMSGKSGSGAGNCNPNNSWHQQTAAEQLADSSVDDVFSSATQSEFMHSAGDGTSRPVKTRGQRQPSNGAAGITGGSRYRPSRGGALTAAGVVSGLSAAGPVSSSRIGEPMVSNEPGNYWKSNNSNRGAFNSAPRFPRSNRGRGGRGRGGNGGSGPRQAVMNEELTS